MVTSLALILWHLRFKLDADKVERVQRRATRLVPGFRNLTYEERLRVLNLYSLYYHRRRGDMITLTVYKLLNGLLGISDKLFFTRAIHSATRGHNYKLYTKRSKLDIRYKFFSQRVIADWNSLPSNVVNAKGTESFKKLLDKHWWDQRFNTTTHTIACAPSQLISTVAIKHDEQTGIPTGCHPTISVSWYWWRNCRLCKLELI